MLRITCLFVLAGLAPGSAWAQVPTVRSAAGSSGTVQTSVTDFLNDLGGSNNGAQPPQSSGQRSINWDAVPDGDAAPGRFPGNFFNKVSTRGAEFTTPGAGFQVSADTSNPSSTPPLFANLVANHSTNFAAFSAERIFTALGSNTIDVHFRLAGTDTRAGVRGFGAVFCDVDTPGTTFLEYYSGARLLHQEPAPAAPGSALFSFVGVSFIDAIVTRVRITLGDSPTGPAADDISNNAAFPDVVVLDDFFYGEPLELSLDLLIRALPAALDNLGLDERTEAQLVRRAAKLVGLGEAIVAAANVPDAAAESKLIDRALKEIAKLQLLLALRFNNDRVQALLTDHLAPAIDIALLRKSLLSHS